MLPLGRHFCLPCDCQTVNTPLLTLNFTQIIFLLTRWCLLLTVSATSISVVNAYADSSYPHNKAKLAIIIDDVGYKLDEGSQAILMNEAITISIIPFSPYDESLAQLAYDNDKEVMLHAPMTPIQKQRWERGLNSTMTRSELSFAFTEMLSRVPHSIGVNNHGGSLFTQDRQRMTWLMNTLKKHNLYFIDSRTTADSTGVEVAIETGIPHAKRDLFLDNDLTEAAVRFQLDQLVTIATQRGSAIAIGHPHKVTLNTLEKYFPTFKQQNIELVSASKLLNSNNHSIAIANVMATVMQ